MWTLEDEVLQTRRVDIGGTPINVRKRASAVFEEEDLAVVPLRLGSFAVEVGSSWDVRPQKNFWEEERGEITGSCELCGSVEGLWRKLLAFLMQQPGILFSLEDRGASIERNSWP